MAEEHKPSEQHGGTTPDEAEVREKGPWAAKAADGVVPAELGESDAVLGRTTDWDEPATEGGVDLSAGDEADATTDGGSEPPEGVEPDTKDIGAPTRQPNTDNG